MKQNLFALMTMALSISALTLVVSCGEDEEVTPNTEQNGNQNGQGDQGGETPVEKTPDPVVVVVDADGNASDGHRFYKVDDNNFYVDFILYTLIDGELSAKNYVDSYLDANRQPVSSKGVVSIIDELDYNGQKMKVTSIGEHAFRWWGGLKSIILPATLTSIDEYAFQECTNLTTINIPKSVTSIGKWAFAKCSSLASIVIPEGMTSIAEYTFFGCTSLTSVTLPSTLTSIGSAAFDDCSALKSIAIPESVTEIGGSAFSRCSSLTSVNIPKGITNFLIATFSSCSSLTSITVPEGVTIIAQVVFRDCSSLTSVTIPSTVTKLGSLSFAGCSSLQDFYCYAVTAPQVVNDYEGTFVDTPISEVTLHVPASAIEAYKSTVPWSGFGSIVAIE